MSASLDLAPMPVGWFRLQIWRRGKLVEMMDEQNAITIGYRDAAAAAIGGQQSAAVTQIGFGSSLAAASYGNTGLTGAFLKQIDGAAVPGGNSGNVVFSFSLASAEAIGLSIGEFGLVTANGTLFARKARLTAPIAKDAETVLSGTWTINFVGPA